MDVLTEQTFAQRLARIEVLLVAAIEKPDARELLTPRQVAAEYRIDRATVIADIESRRLRATRRGKRWLVRRLHAEQAYYLKGAN